MPKATGRTMQALLIGLLLLGGVNGVVGQAQNHPPEAAQIQAPADGATLDSSKLTFQVSATDSDGDRLRFKIIVAQPEAPPPPPQSRSRLRSWEFDQTKSTAGWDQQDYGSGAVASFTPPTDQRLPGGYFIWWVLAYDGKEWGPASEQRSLTLTTGPDNNPPDGVVDDFELLAYIDRWALGEVEDFDLLAAIDWWATGTPPA